MLARDYTYQQKEITREIDGRGRSRNEHEKKSDVIMLYGRPFTRLIEKDGRPLSSSEKDKQEKQLAKETERRRRATEEENSKERREYEKRRAEARRFLNEIPEAYEFKLLGEEAVSGMPAWILQAEPRPGYSPKEARARMFPKIHGRIWIDKAAYQWVKVEAQTIAPISFGLFLARLSEGSWFRFEQRRVNDEVWLPSRIEVGIDGRVGFAKKKLGMEVTYANYQKFQADSKIVSTQAIEQ
jgi:hypothetical protein